MSIVCRTSFTGRQSGVAAVEFALVAVMFFTLLFGIMEIGRLIFYWNSAVEATRVGARTAVVCDKDSAAVFTRMKSVLPILASVNDITVTYPVANCSADCELTVAVKLDSVTVATMTNFLPFKSLKLPPMSTTLTVESLRSAIDGASNPVCN